MLTKLNILQFNLLVPHHCISVANLTEFSCTCWKSSCRLTSRRRFQVLLVLFVVHTAVSVLLDCVLTASSSNFF